MRIDLKKFLFAGLILEKEGFFKKAQELGVIHFVNMDSYGLKEVPPSVTHLSQAIKVLFSLPVLPQEELDDGPQAEKIANQILSLKHETETIAEQLRVLKLEIERVRIFGNFSPDDIAYIEKEGHRKFQYFYGKAGSASSPDLPEDLIFVGSDHNLDYFVAINKELKSYPHFVEMQIDEPHQMLLKKEYALFEAQSRTERKLKTYSKYNTFLHHALIHNLNEYQLKTAIASAQPELNGELYFAMGFVPVNKIEKMKALSSEMNVYVDEIAIDENEMIPTYLENEGAHRIGEDLVHIYDTPSHTDKDPSLWVLLAFALFFSMIIGDAGYGLVFLAAALFIRYKTGVLKGLGKRVWQLVLILSVGCIIWGTMSHSFFGIEMSVKSPFHQISLLNWLAEKKAEYYLSHQTQVYEQWIKEYPNMKEAVNGSQVLEFGVRQIHGKETHPILNRLNDSIMLELALVVGIIHVTLGFIRYLTRNWSGFGWILFMFGCYLYFPSYLKTISMTNYLFGISVQEAASGGLFLIYTGLFLAFFLSILKHKIYGLLEVMNVIQVFGDILSYLRIYALGLAGAIVMATINEFAWSLNFILGPLLFVVGHTINMALGIMGGVIHGLRLNFIEWYHYSFEGGGKNFNPLHKKSIE